MHERLGINVTQYVPDLYSRNYKTTCQAKLHVLKLKRKIREKVKMV